MMAFKTNVRSSTDEWVESEETLWLSDDGKLVADGDPRAATLFAVPGQRISTEDAERYGLVKARAKQGDKQRAAGDDKSVEKPETKSRRKST